MSLVVFSAAGQIGAVSLIAGGASPLLLLGTYQALRKIDERGREESRADDVPGGLGILADLIRTSPENARLFDAFWREGARSRVVPAEEFLGGVPEGLRGSYTLVPAAARPATVLPNSS